MFFVTASTLLLATAVLATLAPCHSNTPGKCPTKVCGPATRVSKAIQAAECAYNTRTHDPETFAIFRVDHQYDKSHGAPYGDCYAYTCLPAPTPKDMGEINKDCHTFFWSGQGEQGGTGTSCIKSPIDGACGCEDSDGTFIPHGTNCH